MPATGFVRNHPITSATAAMALVALALSAVSFFFRADDGAMDGPIDRRGIEEMIARYNSGELDYLDLPFFADDDVSGAAPLTLETLVTWSDFAFVARVVDIKWEAVVRSFPMKVVSYAPPGQVVFGKPHKPLKVRGQDTGPYGSPQYYMTPRFGVREHKNEVYLVFSRYNERSDLHLGVFRGGFILLDGDRIADSEAARELGIQGRKVDDVIAELRRLKGN